MTVIIKMDYERMAEMSKSFQQGAQQLEETSTAMNAISQDLRGGGDGKDGALLGQGGNAYVEAIDARLVKAIGKLQEKFVEMQNEVMLAVEDMQTADTTSRDLF